jgi:hypothetical protein
MIATGRSMTMIQNTISLIQRSGLAGGIIEVKRAYALLLL